MTARNIKGRHAGQRSVVVAVIAATHLFVLVSLATQSTGAAPPSTPAMALLSFREPAPDVAPLLSQVEEPLPASLEPVFVAPEELIEFAEPAASSMVTTMTQPSGPGDCVAADAVQSALSAAPEVRLALAQVPVGQRSVADAVVIWNVTWTALASADDAPLASVRNVVTRTLRALPSACVGASVTGPRFFLIETPGGVMVLTFGSGNWRWQDVAGNV